MRIHLGGHLDWYDAGKRSWLELTFERPITLLTLAEQLGVPPGEIAIVAVNRRQANLETDGAGNSDIVEFFPAIGGGSGEPSGPAQPAQFEMLRNPHLGGAPFTWAGGPDGVLLIHGFTATTAEVRPLAQHLHGQGYTVAGPLLPGHHTQPDEINRYRWQDWVQTAEDAYRQLAERCRRVVVGGESTGGLLALYLASQHPEAAAILAYAPALRLNGGRLRELTLYAAAPFVAHVPKPAHRGPPTEADALWQGYTVNPLRGVIELLRLQRVVRRRLGAIHQPILLVQGRLDQTVHPSAPQIIYDNVRSVVKEQQWMERSTHCAILDQEREQIFALTTRFLARALT